MALNHLRILSLSLNGGFDILIVPWEATTRRHMPVSLFEKSVISLHVGESYPLQTLASHLRDLGYERDTLVEEKGQFAVRGDILDVFPPHVEEPFRLSFFDQEIESIKTFNPGTQRTQGEVPMAQVIPAREILLSYLRKNAGEAIPQEINTKWKSRLKKLTDARNLEKSKRDQVEEFIKNEIHFHGIESFLPLFYQELSTLWDYLPKEAIVVCQTLGDLQILTNEGYQSLQAVHKNSEHIESIFEPSDLSLSPVELMQTLKGFTYLDTNAHLRPGEEPPESIEAAYQSNLKLKTKVSTKITKIHNLAPLASELNQKRLDGFVCLLVCQSLSQLKRMQDLLERFQLPLRVVEKSESDEFLKNLNSNKPDSRLVYLLEGHLREGFVDLDRFQWWISDEEIFGKKAHRAPSRTENAEVFSSFSELTEGDYLIHMDHGIGLYQGLVNLDFDVHKNDFLALEYLGGDKLYVPVDNLARVQRYVSAEGHVPQVDKLGSPAWKKTRSKAKKAARKLAGELLKIQAMRESLVSHRFDPHIPEMEEFSATFPFEETPDQLRAIDESLEDMQSTKPMDRLICGDVGYGKTEVALRAAYLSILDHKQSAVLVPTTVLAFQHYTTLKERFQNYPLKIELLSRFRTAAEQRDVVAKLKTGEVDIVVGTHRLLSKDIEFRDLGLLVIDEEHRFGVTHKEKIKKLKELVDVMTLTATPIPRTLNFALNGIRDLSIINTPPVDRLAIKTYTCHFEPETMRDAMLKELRRGGQIFFLHNRVQSIERVTKKIQELMPEARVRYGHGQMTEESLEELMIAFMNHEFDIFVCTTIIESGVDIPNANTMIIDRADQLGLAQLYQLRGRVGRSDRQAYCYLIIPAEDLITTKAKKRLATIQKFTALGSGFKVASHDLEIRGAGNILGDEQSGHIAAIGYDMYLQLLKEAVHELQNEHIPEDFETEVKLQVAAKIPESYIPDKQLRLMLYKQLSSAVSSEEIDGLRDSWLDRFGAFPEEVAHLYRLMRLKILAKDLLILQLKETGAGFLVEFHPNHKIDIQNLLKLVQWEPKTYAITRDQKFAITKKLDSPEKKFEFLKEFMEKLT